MLKSEVEELTEKGLSAMEHGHFYLAHVCFERAAAIEKNPLAVSCLGFCLAATRQQFEEAAALCREAITLDPANTLHYLNLGRIFLMCGKREDAIQAFRESFKFGRDNRIIRELDLLGTRKPPVFSSLGRDHFLNRNMGKILRFLGLR